MTDQDTLFPAIMQLAAQVRSTLMKKPCQVCGAEETKAFVFAYAKKIKQEVRETASALGTTTTTTSTYDSLGAQAVHLCKNCVDAHRKRMISGLWAWIIPLILVSIALITAVILMPGSQVVLTIFATVGTIATLILFVRLSMVRSKPDLAGSNKAVKLSRPALEKQGYDSFWQDADNPM